MTNINVTARKEAVVGRANRIKSALSIAFIGDFCLVFLGLIVGHWLRFQSGIFSLGRLGLISGGIDSSERLEDYLGLIVFGSILLSCTYLVMDLYDPRNLLRYRATVLIVIRAMALWLAVYLGLSLVLKFNPPISRIYAVCSTLSAAILVLVWRYLYSMFIKSGDGFFGLRKRVAFLGWSQVADHLVKSVESDRGDQHCIVGYISERSDSSGQAVGLNIPLIGHVSELSEILSVHSIDILIKADSQADVSELIRNCNICDREMVQFKLIPNRFHMMIAGLHLETICDVSILGINQGPLERPINRLMKRGIDILGSIFGLVFSVPLIILFGALVYIESPGPILYRQTRTGRRGRNFEILKIRSMRLNAEALGGVQWAKKGDDRRLRIGAFMRGTNIDEVPQFWNVLKGDMSLVGPRPERPEFISRFQNEIPHYNSRLSVKPGITGWAQINGLRGDTDLTERVKHDLYYIENWSLISDFVIMIRTLWVQKNAY